MEVLRWLPGSNSRCWICVPFRNSVKSQFHVSYGDGVAIMPCVKSWSRASRSAIRPQSFALSMILLTYRAINRPLAVGTL